MGIINKIIYTPQKYMSFWDKFRCWWWPNFKHWLYLKLFYSRKRRLKRLSKAPRTNTYIEKVISNSDDSTKLTDKLHLYRTAIFSIYKHPELNKEDRLNIYKLIKHKLPISPTFFQQTINIIIQQYIKGKENDNTKRND